MEATTKPMPTAGAQLTGEAETHSDLLTPEALTFLTKLYRRFSPSRRNLLQERTVREQ